MAKEPDDLELQLLRTMQAENAARFNDIEAVMISVQSEFTTSHLQFDGLDEGVERIREETVAAVGYAAGASRGHTDLKKQIADLARRVENLETRQ